jgi:hypothetical protein
MKLNTVDVVERHNRPGPMKKVLLRCDFISNGAYTDPFDISSVSLFRKAQNVSPSTVLDTSTELITDSASSSVKWRWVEEAGGYIDPDTYTDADAPYIIKFSTGRYGVVLDGVNRLTTATLDRLGNTIYNSASGAGHYIDVWTVKMTEDSEYRVFINPVELFSDSFLTVTQPVTLRAKNKLQPNQVRLGEVVDLKVTTDITVTNRDIDQTIKNLFSQSVVDSPSFRIVKHNEDSNLPARVEVSGYAETAPLIRTTSDNTMILNFNTSSLTASPGIEGLGTGTGTYSVEAKYTILNETRVSPMMYFTVR